MDKRRWRMADPADAGVAVTLLPSLDAIDAALAALTALYVGRDSWSAIPPRERYPREISGESLKSAD